MTSFNAKNLQYEKQEPAFLRRLRTEHGGDRHNFTVSRPRNSRLDTGDDDGPTIVDEAGQNVTLDQIQALHNHGRTKEEDGLMDPTQRGGAGEAQANEREAGGEKQPEGNVQERRKQTIAKVGEGLKKRKQVKIVEGDVVPESNDKNSQGKGQNGVVEQKSKAKPKKTKKMKLSFNELDG